MSIYVFKDAKDFFENKFNNTLIIDGDYSRVEDGDGIFRDSNVSYYFEVFLKDRYGKMQKRESIARISDSTFILPSNDSNGENLDFDETKKWIEFLMDRHVDYYDRFLEFYNSTFTQILDSSDSDDEKKAKLKTLFELESLVSAIHEKKSKQKTIKVVPKGKEKE